MFDVRILSLCEAATQLASGFWSSYGGNITGSELPAEAILSGLFDENLVPDQHPRGQITVEPARVSARLLNLHDTLDPAMFQEVNEHGYRARVDVTAAHPTTAAGTFHWHQAVFALRTALFERGWTKKDLKNCPFILSPDRSVAILVMTGDADTGLVQGFPTNQSQKGTVLKQAISGNYELFETAMISKLERMSNGTEMWVLLYHVGIDENGRTVLRSELSRPSRFERKKIAGWMERIILGPIHPDGEHEMQVDSPIAPKPIDVPVERRAS